MSREHAAQSAGNQDSEVAQHDAADNSRRARDPHLVDCFHSGCKRPRQRPWQRPRANYRPITASAATTPAAAAPAAAPAEVLAAVPASIRGHQRPSEAIRGNQRCLRPPKRPPRRWAECVKHYKYQRRLSARSQGQQVCGLVSRRCHGRLWEIVDGPTMSWESSGQSDLSEPVCLVQRLPLFVESLFEFVWEGSGDGLCWSWCVRRRMGNSLPVSIPHVCCDLCAWRSPVAGAPHRIAPSSNRSRRRLEFA